MIINDSSEYLDVKQAALFLNLKVSKIRSMINKREIARYKFGRLIRFKKDELEAWIESKKVERE